MNVKNNQSSLQTVLWQNIRTKFAKIQPQLTTLIDDLCPGKDFPLYLICYPFGSIFLDDGVFMLPTSSGKLVPISDAEIPQNVQKGLAYAGTKIPAGIVLTKSVEAFICIANRIVPQRLYSAGEMFALWGHMLSGDFFYHPPRIFSMSSGARSIFMLPKIGDYYFHKNLEREFNLTQSPPKSLNNHWEVFTELSRHPDLNCSWATELIFFSEKWIKKIYDKKDQAWNKLRIFLFEYLWKKSVYQRNQILYHLIISSVFANNYNNKPNPYLIDTLKYLLAIAAGAKLGFTAGTDNISAPIDLLQNVYLEHYRLREYIPTIMHPAYLTKESNLRALYYSLQFPISEEFSQKTRKFSVALQDLTNLRYIVNYFLQQVCTGSLKVDDTLLGWIAKIGTIFNLYSNPGSHKYIIPANELAKIDPKLLYSKTTNNQLHFAATSTFFHGCVRISQRC
ncbi:MAG: hypothetical protein M1561_08030 [Gammaproteobacteria bacterium]|nr:hypothetical protein [Gammaproteobacteria bacterium]